MFEVWEERFSANFATYKTQIEDLMFSEQVHLENVLNLLWNSGLLNEKSLNQLLGSNNLLELMLGIEELANASQLSENSMVFLFSLSKPAGSAMLITRALNAGVDFEVIKKFLCSVALDGIKNAIDLFDHSGFTYTEEYFSLLKSLASLLANPLCQVIFEARLRAFEGYLPARDPLNYSNSAHEIIDKLGQLNKQEEKIKVFFNFFARYRPVPTCQDFLEIKLDDYIVGALNQFCRAQIAAIKTKEDYLSVKHLIKALKTRGDKERIFNFIKDDVAAAIERDDLYSQRDYDSHMVAIKQALNKPQELQDFTIELKQSCGYQMMLTTQMQDRGLWAKSTKDKIKDDKNSLLVLGYENLCGAGS